MSWPIFAVDHWTVAAAGLTALLLALLLTPLLRPWAVRHGWVAKPTRGRWKRRVVARLGGIAMVVAFLVAVLAWLPA